MISTLIFLTLISAIGIFLTLRNTIKHTLLSILVAFGAGSMLTVAILHIFPEAITHSHYGALAFLGGFIAMYVLEEIFSPHSHDHTHHDHSHEDPREHSHHIAIVAFLAIFIHTLFDGMAIRAGITLSESTSLAIILGIAIHQIPVSLSLAAIFKKSQLPRKTQITLMILFALSISIGFGISHIIFELIGKNITIIATAITG